MHPKNIFRKVLLAACLAALAVPLESHAQTSSLNAFSPYTMYGLGDMWQQGNAETRIMGGAGVAYRNGTSINYLNPASLSAIPQHSAIFNFGASGQNYYSKTALNSTSKNNFTFSDLAIAFPLASKVGFAVSMTPYSAVGYETNYVDENPEVIENIGRAIYNYRGEGGLSQLNASLGVEVTKGLSLGASLIYYFGSLERRYDSSLENLLQPIEFSNVMSFTKTQVSQVLFSVGAQYQFRIGKNEGLSVGATFQPKGTIKSRYTKEQMSVRDAVTDTITMIKARNPIVLPAKFEAGIFYNHGRRWVVVADYSYQNWKNAFEIPAGEEIGLRSQHQIRAGVSFTPNPGSYRQALKRWSYRLGLRYSTNYMTFQGQNLEDMAVSLGFVIPFKRDKYSRVTIGAELGQRGTTRNGQIRDRYVNIFAGFTLFGEAEDLWFRRQKLN